MPGAIWASGSNCLTVFKTPSPNVASIENSAPAANLASGIPTQGFYGTRGVVTFHDRVFGNECIFVQQGDSPAMITLESNYFQGEFKLEHLVDTGGGLKLGQYS